MNMLKKLVSVFLLSITGYYVYQNRYRLMNRILGNSILRRFAVSSLMGIPGIRQKIFQSVFSGPSEIR
jgi:hypothetical protein